MKTLLKNCLLILLSAFSVTACSTDDADTSGGKILSDSERQIALFGQPNMRDLGGYRNIEGRIIKTQTLYRSGDLSGLTTDDLSKVNGLGIKSIVDLRSSNESLTKPDKCLFNSIAYRIPLLSYKYTSDPGYMYKILSNEKSAEEYMLPVYTVDDQKIQSWRTFFGKLQTGNAVLFHCTDGKDHTGMTAALLLAALDVPRETIVKDFLLSNRYMAAEIEDGVAQIEKYYGEGSGDKLRPILSVEKEYIDAFFTDIEVKYGSVDYFLINVLQVDKNQMKRLYLN